MSRCIYAVLSSPILRTVLNKVKFTVFPAAERYDYDTMISPAGFSRQAYVMPLLLSFLFFMAAMRTRRGHVGSTFHYIFALWFLLLLLSSIFFRRLISAVADWMSAILPYMVYVALVRI